MELKEMVAAITKEILQTMQTEVIKPMKILFVFCDSTAHEPFMDQFIRLQNAGIGYDMLFLDGETSAWVNMHRVESGGSGKAIAVDEYAPAPIELPKQYDGIVIPEIDLDNAGRVVSGVKGTIKAEIIFAALVLGKFVLIGEDAPGLKRADRRCLKALELPEPYRKLFLKQIDEMKSLGIEFRPQRELAAAIISKRDAPASPPQETAAGRSEGDAANGMLLTAERVRSFREFPGNRLTLRKSVILTPLARDLLREKGIAVDRIE